jgi:hypothetical protein
MIFPCWQTVGISHDISDFFADGPRFSPIHGDPASYPQVHPHLLNTLGVQLRTNTTIGGERQMAQR